LKLLLLTKAKALHDLFLRKKEYENEVPNRNILK
jgi:hypothetical protein